MPVRRDVAGVSVADAGQPPDDVRMADAGWRKHTMDCAGGQRVADGPRTKCAFAGGPPYQALQLRSCLE